MPQISLLLAVRSFQRAISILYKRRDESMYTALYRAYRPEVFEQLLGQEHIILIHSHDLTDEREPFYYKTIVERMLSYGTQFVEPKFMDFWNLA